MPLRKRRVKTKIHVISMIVKQKILIKRVFLILINCFFSAIIFGCSIPTLSLNLQNLRIGKPIPLIASEFISSPTPTPFLPSNPTPTYIPTAMPTLVPTQVPKKEVSSSEENYSKETIIKNENLVKLLILGSDQRLGDVGFRTDTIILVLLNTENKTASMVSFPRDLYVPIPGYSYQRINTAMFYGGFDTIALTLQSNFGLRPDYYILVNFQAFEKIIDTLGGVDVDVSQPFSDRYLTNKNKQIPVGTVHMDSSLALWYARSRQTSNDFDRARRQQEVLYAIGDRLISLETVEKAKDLYKILSENVTTNLKWSDIKPLLPTAFNIRKPSQVNRFVIGPGQVYDWITPGGAMVLIPRSDQISILLKEASGY